MSWIDVVWPILELEPNAARLLRLDADVREIEQSTWPNEPEKALVEAQAIAKREEDRRLSTDGKASNYLLAIVTLMPLLTYLESTVWEHKFGTAPNWVSLPLLAISVLYLLGAGFWAFRTLTVGTFHTLDAKDLRTIWQSPNRDNLIVNEVLKNARRNREPVNYKVSCIKMTHIFLRRGIMCFGFLVLAEAGWSGCMTGWPVVRTAIVTHLQEPPKPAEAPATPAAAVSVLDRRSAACNPTELAMNRATDEMNKQAGAGQKFRGSAAYWVRLASSRRADERAAGHAWESLRQLYSTSSAFDCEAGNRGADGSSETAKR